jgi:signal transduction histidine kinase
VQRLVPRLYEAIDRAVALTSRTLDFLREEAPPMRASVFQIRDLLADVDRSVRAPDGASPLLAADGSALDSKISADRDQLFRVFSNLALNAAQAGARTIHIDAERVDSRVVIDVRDDGGGIPPKVRERLFLPFAGSGRDQGAGLGL